MENIIFAFQLTRSVGSVTLRKIKNARSKLISTHTLRGERDYSLIRDIPYPKISTHTLRGERDNAFKTMGESINISTHTLRGERDFLMIIYTKSWYKFQLTRSVGSVTRCWRSHHRWIWHFNSHAPWGAWPKRTTGKKNNGRFQLTRSVGSVTELHYCYTQRAYSFQLTRSVGSVTFFSCLKRFIVNFNSHAPWGAWQTPTKTSTKTANFNSHAPWGAWPEV